MFMAMQLATVLAASSGFGVGPILIGIIVGGGIGAVIRNTKGRMGLGLVLGALLGCIGWLIIALIPRKA
jgi:hypothetical protein